MTTINKKSERGSTTVESLGVLIFVLMCTAALLFTAYIIFAMGWIRYQSEQGLYCKAEGGYSCTRETKNNLTAFLRPDFTESLNVDIFNVGDQKWRSKVEWKIKKPHFLPSAFGFKLKMQRELSLESIRGGRKDLQWSPRLR